VLHPQRWSAPLACSDRPVLRGLRRALTIGRLRSSCVGVNSVDRSFFAELKRRNVVRVAALYLLAAWLILQIADVLFGMLDVPEWSGRLVIGLLVLGFPLALIFSWVYELTPQGLKRQQEVDRQQSVVHETGRKLNIAIGVLASIAILGMVADRLIPRSTGPTSAVPAAASPEAAAPAASAPATALPSVAVLPFADMSQERDQEYFADGLSEELLNLLARIDGLRVIARTSSFQFKGRSEDVRLIAEQLGVANILEGSVRKAGETLRVSAQLIRASDGSNLWSGTYDRELDDVFAVQDDIAAAVVEVLRLKLLSGSDPVRAVRHDTGAYNLYLQGRFYLDGRSRESLDKAEAFFRSATERDPDFALAWVGLSTAYQYQAGTTGQIPVDEGYRAARQAAERALALDPELALAHAAVGLIHASYDWDWAAADERMRRAYALAPTDAEILGRFAAQDLTMGRFEQAIERFQQAIDRDPLRAPLRFNLSLVLIAAGRYGEAEAVARQALELAPTGAPGYAWQVGFSLLMQGEYAEAERFAAKETSAQWKAYGTALLSFAQGKPEADADLQRLIDEMSSDGPYQIAEVYAYRDEPDQAFEWLERAYRQRDPGVAEILASPFLRRYAQDPRYAAFLKKVGLPDRSRA